MSFDTFVVGTNGFAHNAVLALAEGRSSYSPLYLFGGEGTGKTHLLRAIGERVLSLHPTMDVTYMEGGDLRLELLHSRTEAASLRFFETHRKHDMLLLDGLEEALPPPELHGNFAEMLRIVHARGGRVVISGSRYFRDIPGVPQRLTNFLLQGLSVPLETQDRSTRTAILRQMCLEEGVSVGPNVVTMMAQRASANQHALRGIAKWARSIYNTRGRPPSVEDVEVGVTHLEPNLQVHEVFEVVCRFYNVSQADIKGPRRPRRLIEPRHVAMFFIRRGTAMSLPQIGRIFNRDHTTVLHALESVEGNLSTNAIFKQKLKLLAGKLGVPLVELTAEPVPA
ncbi:hypothetical protein HYW18_02480 [Candidatus Uhrbacteria bacterium]|nr:hypothetical protein [Candidatus Uhrbacteria bacterium]